MLWHDVLMGERRDSYRIWLLKKGGKSPHGRTRRIWDYIITVNTEEVRWGNGLV